MIMISFRKRILTAVFRHNCRRFSISRNTHAEKKGLVLGVYEKEKEDENLRFTEAAETFDRSLSGRLRKLLSTSGPPLKKGKSRVFYGIHEEFPSVVVVGLGKNAPGICEKENWDISKENIRAAVSVYGHCLVNWCPQGDLCAYRRVYNMEGPVEYWQSIMVPPASCSGCRVLQELEVPLVEVDPCRDAQAAAEGAVLGLFEYDEFKRKKKFVAKTQLHGNSDTAAWERGVLYAEGQNLARRLMEAPANHMTPKIFADTIEQKLASLSDKVTIYKRPQSWIEEQQMGAFLSVSKGSDEPPLFLELHYNGSPDTSQLPLVLVGKGITFDSGGISLKPSTNMDAMRADMGGAATVCSSIVTAAALKLPVNIVGLTPLCENMPSGKAAKPGDVVKARNGKTIQVDNTDAEGRLILADALCYAHNFNPKVIVNAATLTGAMDVALGSAVAGVFTNSDWLWRLLHKASIITGDRVWRMPLFQHYTRQVTESQLADLSNVGKYSRSGGACTAAAFLKEFVTTPHWAHLDIAGVMSNKDEVPYLCKGMSGRPTRTLVELAASLSDEA